MNPALTAVAIQQLPSIVQFIRETFVKKHPDAPVPTDEEIIAANRNAVASSLAKDDQWLAAHPE